MLSRYARVPDAVGASLTDLFQTLPSRTPNAIANGAASYLITGGTGGIGRSITKWLARQGAKHIVLASRSGMSQMGIPEMVEKLRGQGVNVVVIKCDISDRAQVEKLMSQCQATLPPIKGVIHGAMALRDALFEKITFTDWELNINPRVHGAWNLHHCLSAASTNLDFFLSLASLSGCIGNPGQAAYAASNTFLDAFTSHRRDLGLPASVIDIGIVEGVGYVAENQDRDADISTTVHDRIPEAELLALVKAAIVGPATHHHHHPQTLTGLKLSPDKPLTFWTSDPKFLHVLADAQSGSSSSSSTNTHNNNNNDDGDLVLMRNRLQQAKTPEAAVELICHSLTRKLSKLLLIAPEDVDPTKPVVAYGLDSLIAVELRNWMTIELGCR